MTEFYAITSTEDIDLKVVNLAGCFFFVQTLTGAAWANLAAMVTELESRTGDEEPDRFMARCCLSRGRTLLALKSTDFGA